ncbi:phage tail protein [Aquimarina sp. AD10]|uniref:type VI secretion system tube protein TssD n=1 Tax=Aquimarina TaxID=290174 RepID=UPI000E4EEC40|nr:MULTISPECIES: type VI secretion system tube protein TssD [Aquimarina]AXT60383.1 phage tail protein [Aquimarina sp. AD10]RKN01182.1 phage tail protein [Aquimarina sp. AD10]
MSFKAKLKVGGQEYNVLSCTYALNQETDATGRPSSVTRGGKIDLVIESSDGTEMFEWQCSSFERKDGSITFTKRDNDATLKTINFTEGYLVKFKEQFDSTGSNPLTTSFCISAREIESGQGKHINEWK